jgi:hypothetical protein
MGIERNRVMGSHSYFGMIGRQVVDAGVYLGQGAGDIDVQEKQL